MPNDYYVSQYSGEEIDERLTAAHNAVRYDAAQSLTDAQKQQAKRNIAAAPDGFGLGIIDWNQAPESDANKIPGTGWFLATNNTPAAPGIWFIRQEFDGPSNNDALQTAWPQNLASYYRGCLAQRYKISGTWSAWEWVNPPMQLGVEYRTTERYLGKPVYVKKVDFGNAPAVSIKEVGCATNVANVVDFNLTVWNGAYGQENIIINDAGTLVARPYSKLSEGTLSIALAVFEDISTRTVDLVVKYTKTTD